MNNIQEEIFRSIENLSTKNKSVKTDIPAIITGVEGSNKYRVKIDGVERVVTDGIGLDLKTGSSIWIHAMNGDMGSLYVICKR